MVQLWGCETGAHGRVLQTSCFDSSSRVSFSIDRAEIIFGLNEEMSCFGNIVLGAVPSLLLILDSPIVKAHKSKQ